MSFLSQIKFGRWVARFLAKILGMDSYRPYSAKFSKGDVIRKKRPKDAEDWEVWDGQEPMEILDIGRKNYKVYYENKEKFKNTYSKLDINGHNYANWRIRETDDDYEKIRVSNSHIATSFDKELEDMLDE